MKSLRHIDKYLDENALVQVSDILDKKFKDCLISSHISCRELTVVCRKQSLRDVLKFLRDDKACMFKVLVDLCGVDQADSLGTGERFEVVYHLLSIRHNQRIRVKVRVKDGVSTPTVSDLFQCANWYEREAYDMYGILFADHPDLRRILSDYNFDGFPLRKDFPVCGKVEAYYDTDQGKVAYKPVDMPQETRSFDWESPWEAMTGNTKLSEDNIFDENEFKK